jgi:excinuclease ABC subunit C
MFDVIKLPQNSGCYLFKDKNDKIIYVGKAKNIRKRVRSYIQKKELDAKTQSLINRVELVDYIITDNEVEAFILENTLIKKHQPKYNIDLKDAKNYAYIRITKEEFPRMLIARNKKDKGKFYGPFVSAKERDYVLRFLRKTFLIRTCKRMPKKTCLRYHINLCSAPCVENITKQDYGKEIDKVKLILSGNAIKLIKQMKKEMNKYAKKSQFEKSLKLRDEITAVEKLSERQNMQRQKSYNEDIINYEIKDEKVYLILFNVYKGTLSNKDEYIFDYNDDFFDEFLIQYYSENPIPKEIIVPEDMDDSIVSFLQTKKGGRVQIIKPLKGEKKQLLDLVEKNIDITFFKSIGKINSIKTKLKLQQNPLVIECFDISHLSGTSTVGSMVQFRNGKPDKNNYRRFRIRSVKKIDDYEAISEVVRRRYTRLKNEESEFPNLIIVDGGRGQLNTALHELEKLDLKIPIISIAKQLEELYIPGRLHPLRLEKKDKALKFIQEIRDEAHRFAIKYNKLLRKKELIS